MYFLPRLTARLAAVASLAALAAACDPQSKDVSGLSSTLSASKQAPASGGSGFTLLGNAAVTCTNGTIIGDVGTFAAAPTGAITLTGCPVTGTSHVGDGAAISAYNAFLAAYAALAPKTGDVCPLITGTLAGQNLAPGVYCVSAEAKTGLLTLTGPANGTWTIKVPAGALTGTNFSVVMAGGAQACNVTWWVDAAATLTTSNLKGNILAGAAITLTGGTLIGDASARAGVTVTGTAVTGCEGGHVVKPPKDKCHDKDKHHYMHKHHDKDKHHDGCKDKHDKKDKHNDDD